jgi:hypothetical protein
VNEKTIKNLGKTHRKISSCLQGRQRKSS